MKIYILIIALIGGLCVSLKSAIAHGGHTWLLADGHVHSAEYIWAAFVCLVLLSLFASIVLGRGR